MNNFYTNTNNFNTVRVFIASNEHANLDSLPLRFGFNFEHNNYVDLKVFSKKKSEKFSDRVVYDASIFSNYSNRYERGTFVVLDNNFNQAPKLVTAWRNDKDDEFYLSELMKNLRLDKLIDSEWLKSVHDLYLNGTISKCSDILDILIKENNDVHRSKYEELVNDLEAEVFKEKSRADKAERKLQEMLASEQLKADLKGSKVVVASEDKLVDVQENALHNGSSCTILVMENGTRWFMKTSTFDRNLAVTKKAKQLINQKIRVTSWDPLREPGKWSSRKYFRNVYAV